MPKTWLIHASFPLRLHGTRPRRWAPKGTYSFWVQYRGARFHLTGRPFKGMCVTALAATQKEWFTLPPSERRWEWPSMKKKLAKAGSEAVKHLAALESSIFDGLLPLIEHCAVRQYDDGDPREPGWITIKTQGSAWIVQVKDPDSACSFAAVAGTLDKALETAALLLSCDDAPWEPDRFLSQQKGRKK